MNLDHLFMVRKGSATDGTIAFLRTDRKGKPGPAFSSEYSSDKSSDAGTYSQVMQDAYNCIGATRERFILVTSLRTEGPKWGQLTRHTVSIQEFAWPLYYNDLLSPDCSSVKELAMHLGIPYEMKGPAADNECVALMHVYWAIMKRYRAALLGEEVAREIGGRPLQKLRELFGV